MKKIYLAVLILISTIFAKDKLDLNFIFETPKIWGEPPTGIKWSSDDSQAAMLWNSYENSFREIWLFDVSSQSVKKITDFASQIDTGKCCRKIRNLSWFPDTEKLLFTFQGDIYSSILYPRVIITNITSSNTIEENPSISPDGNYISFDRENSTFIYSISDDKEYFLSNNITSMPMYINHFWANNSKYIALLETNNFETQVKNGCSRLKIYSVDGREKIWESSQNSGNILRCCRWSPDDESLIVEGISDNKRNRFIAQINVNDSIVDTLYREKWANRITEFGKKIFWIDNDKKLLFGSAKDGYNHLYTLTLESGEDIAITRGQWNVNDYNMDKERRKVVFNADRDGHFDRQIFSYDLAEKKLSKISYLNGTHKFSLSHSGDELLEVYSNSVYAPQLYHCETIPKSRLNKITQIKQPKINKKIFSKPLYKKIINRNDGRDLGYKIWLPDKVSDTKFPVIVNINNGTVLDKLEETAMGNQWLSKKGFIVVEVGYRSLEEIARSQNVDNPVSRQISDIICCIKHVCKNGYVDSLRIGVFGWDYGAYLTTMILLTEHEMVKSGVAVTSLTPIDTYVNYANNNIHKILNNNTISLPSPYSSYNDFCADILFIQGDASSLPGLIESEKLACKMLKARKSVDFIFFPWEGKKIETDESYIHLYHKVYNYFMKNLN